MSRALRVCSRPGCINLVDGRGSLCLEHTQQLRRQRDSGNRRPNSRQNYGPRWPETRRAYLAAHPFCVKCNAPAQHVDHIVAVAAGGAVLDWSNLQSLCHRHHSIKTASQDGGFGNRKKAGEGR